MKFIYSILFFFSSHFAVSKFHNNDSLITNSISFNAYLNKIKEIDNEFSNRENIMYTIDAKIKWKFICSYKKGWEEQIGFSHDSTSSIKIFRQDFNDIHVLRNDSIYFTFEDLKKLFYFSDARFIKDTTGNIISGPIAITKNQKYLIVGLSSYYPNGNQTSWDYRHNYYFTRLEK